MQIITARRPERPGALALLPAAVVCALTLAGAPPAQAATGNPAEALRITDSHRETAMRVVTYARRAHYEHVAVDDGISRETLENFIDLLDGQKLFFLKNQEDYFLRNSEPKSTMRCGGANWIPFSGYTAFSGCG